MCFLIMLKKSEHSCIYLIDNNFGIIVQLWLCGKNFIIVLLNLTKNKLVLFLF